MPAETFRQGSDLVGVNGIVESHGQADLKSQMSAPVAAIHGDIGDSVYKDQVILELQNSDIRAQLEQAKASLSIAEGQYQSGGLSLDSARSSAVDKIRDSYLKGYEAVNTQIDPLLNNSDSNGSRLVSFIADSALGNKITDSRVDLTLTLREWKAVVDKLSPTSSTTEIEAALKLSTKNIYTIDRLLSDISQALNDAAKYATPTFTTFLNSWKAVVSGARSAISGANQSLTGAESALSSANSSYGTTAEAQVSLARAGVNNLEAQFAKTVIRSPINGKIASLPLSVGELATPGQLLATVVGDSGLEIKSYVSGEDLDRIKVGAAVMIQGKVPGIVESVAPSVSNTNRKVEVIIKVSDAANSKLVIGQNVQVSITATNTPKVSNTISNNDLYILPIQDVKIVPGDAFVFTVDENSKIKRNPVTLGEVKGDYIEVISGLDTNMKIVSPVYELDEGESVVTE